MSVFLKLLVIFCWVLPPPWWLGIWALLCEEGDVKGRGEVLACCCWYHPEQWEGFFLLLLCCTCACHAVLVPDSPGGPAAKCGFPEWCCSSWGHFDFALTIAGPCFSSSFSHVRLPLLAEGRCVPRLRLHLGILLTFPYIKMATYVCSSNLGWSCCGRLCFCFI